KLLLGLGLVLAAFALMLTGTVQGLTSYMKTMQLFDSKIAELDEAKEFERSVTHILNPADDAATIDEEGERLRARITFALERLAAYEKRLDDTIEKRRDPDLGVHEKALVKSLRSAFADLDNGIKQAKKPTTLGEGDLKRLIDSTAVKNAA